MSSAVCTGTFSLNWCLEVLKYVAYQGNYYSIKSNRTPPTEESARESRRFVAIGNGGTSSEFGPSPEPMEFCLHGLQSRLNLRAAGAANVAKEMWAWRLAMSARGQVEVRVASTPIECIKLDSNMAVKIIASGKHGPHANEWMARQEEIFVPTAATKWIGIGPAQYSRTADEKWGEPTRHSGHKKQAVAKEIEVWGQYGERKGGRIVPRATEPKQSAAVPWSIQHQESEVEHAKVPLELPGQIQVTQGWVESGGAKIGHRACRTAETE
ncbi:hypothetical protein B0H13DRAFT_1874202 [Mycena leptocephala]|nr:hypothetical protein B0H13DRAFT_1874202 [Mycena leptocephala]